MPLPQEQPAPIKTWFVLGHEPLLSVAEIFSFIGKSFPYHLELPILKIQGDFDSEIIKSLGGTIKMARELGTNLTDTEMMSLIISNLSEVQGKINFGISLYSGSNYKIVEDWGKQIKKRLKEDGRSVRYVFKKEAILSSVSVEKNGLTDKGREFLVLKSGDKFSLTVTTAVQPFESFSQRDYGRPGRDDLSGMLPPKLAIMILNLLGPNRNQSILDPFCGSGTILSEAALLGYKDVFGTDISEKAVLDSIQNIKWMKDNFEFKTSKSNINIQICDATKLSGVFSNGSVHGIATEPYMGIPRRGKEAGEFLQKQAAELASLYKNAFLEFKKILHRDGRIVFVVPRFYTSEDSWISVSSLLVPELTKTGFVADELLPKSLSREPFVLYRRKGQLVGREIWRFKHS